MIEDEDNAKPESGEMLLYDFFKHLTSLCLFALGGIVAMVEKVEPKSRMQLGVIVLVIGLAAVMSFGGAGEIVRARLRPNSPAKYLNAYRVVAPLLLALGVGMFLYLFAKTLRV